MNSQNRMALNLATNRTIRGPHVFFSRDELCVEYDHQGDDGAITWASIVFTDVIAFEFRQEVCCTLESVPDSSSITIEMDSQWLSELRKQWVSLLGGQEWQEKQGGFTRFHHFVVFFDDVGCLEVVAARAVSTRDLARCDTPVKA